MRGDNLQSIGTIKRGDTFSFTAELKDSVTGDALTGAASGLKCQGRHYINNELVAEMEISETETSGTYLFSAGLTSDWESEGMVLFDIEYTDESTGAVSSSETFYATIEGDVTRD